jgi:hypothetical protein
MYRKYKFSLTGALVFFIAVLSFGQEEPKDQLFTVHQDNVKPAMVDQYEKAVNSLVASFKEHGMEIPSMTSSQTDDFTYYYISPIENYAALDEINVSWGEFIEKMGEEKWAEIDDAFEGTYFSHKDFIIRRSGELSYRAENPRFEFKDANFIHWDWYWLEEGKESEAMEVAKEFKNLFAANNITDSFTIWLTDIGTDYGLMVVTQIAKDAEDYYAMISKRGEDIGDEMDLLYEKFVKYVKKFEHENGKLRHDFNYEMASN